VIEKAAPLVVRDHQHSIGPVGTGDHGLIDEVHKGLAVANIGMRMVIPREPMCRTEELRVHKGDVRERPRLTIGQEPEEVVGDGAILGSPQRQSGDVGVIVAALQSMGGEQVPNGR
jgi:hypothetical protein